MQLSATRAKRLAEKTSAAEVLQKVAELEPVVEAEVEAEAEAA